MFEHIVLPPAFWAILLGHIILLLVLSLQKSNKTLQKEIIRGDNRILDYIERKMEFMYKHQIQNVFEIRQEFRKLARRLAEKDILEEEVEEAPKFKQARLEVKIMNLIRYKGNISIGPHIHFFYAEDLKSKPDAYPLTIAIGSLIIYNASHTAIEKTKVELLEEALEYKYFKQP